MNIPLHSVFTWKVFEEYLLRRFLITWVEFEGYLLGNFTMYNIARIKQAFELANLAHRGKIRLDGTPYFNHVVRAAILALSFKIYDTDLIIILLCHDVKEENKKILPKAFDNFGQDNINRLHMLTKSSLPEKNTLYFPFLLKCDDWRTLLAKLFDRPDNQMTLDGAGTLEWREKKNLETVKYFPRLLTRTDFLLRLAVRKGLLPKRPYQDLIKNITIMYYEIMAPKYKHHFVYSKTVSPHS